MPVLAGLGPVRFEVADLSYQELQRAFAFRWTPQERLGRRPAQQFMGPGEETLSLRGTLYPKHPLFFGALAKLAEMRTRAMQGEAFTLAANVAGAGLNYGRWCVKSIQDTQTYFHPDGTPQKVEFTLELVEYGADGASYLTFF